MTAESERERRFVAWGTALAAAALLLGFAVHELWRDEAQAWWLARDAPGFGSLLTGEARRYEGHPFLWFWVLRLASLFSTDQQALTFVAFALALANAVSILTLPGLARFQRALAAFSYFPLFEYGVIARSYALSLFCLLVAVRWLGAQSRLRHVVVGVFAGLAVNTVLAAAIPALIVLAVGYVPRVVDTLRARRLGALGEAGWLVAPVSFGLFVLGAVVTTPVAPDAVAELGPLPPPTLDTLHELGARFFQAFFPIPEPAPSDGVWWSTNALLPDFDRLPQVLPRHRILSGLCAPVGAGAAVAWLVALRKNLVATLALGAGFALTLGLFVRLPVHAIRYEGHLVLCVLCAVAAVAQVTPSVLRGRLVAYVFGLTFGAGVLGAAVALYKDATTAFSQSRNAARRLTELGARTTPIVAFEYYRMAPVAAYVDREFYAPELGEAISHGVWSRSWHRADYFSASPTVVRRGICWALATARTGKPTLLVTTGPMAFGPELSGALRLDSSHVGSQPHEDYWIYVVDPTRARNARPAFACPEPVRLWR